MRAILEEAVAPAERVRLGALLARIGDEAGGVELEVTRETQATEPPVLG